MSNIYSSNAYPADHPIQVCSTCRWFRKCPHCKGRMCEVTRQGVSDSAWCSGGKIAQWEAAHE